MRESEAIPLEAFIRIDKPTMADIDDPVRFRILCAQARQEAIDNSMPQVRDLLAAGWTYELPREELDPWQWAWRAPPKRQGKPGRRYASTQQAFNAMQNAK